MTQTRGHDLKFQVNGQLVTGYIAAAEQGGPGVVVLHAWWGLTPFFKSVCDRLAAEGFVAFAPDLNRDRTAATIEEAKQIMAERDLELTQAIVTSAVTQVLANPATRGTRLGIVGFSMGASWALWLASQKPHDVAATVLFYGTEDVNFNTMQAAILGHYAEHDEWEPLDSVRQMEADMRAAGRDVTLHIYPEAQHWFFEEDRPAAYQAGAAQLAWERTVQFLRDQLERSS